MLNNWCEKFANMQWINTGPDFPQYKAFYCYYECNEWVDFLNIDAFYQQLKHIKCWGQLPVMEIKCSGLWMYDPSTVIPNCKQCFHDWNIGPVNHLPTKGVEKVINVKLTNIKVISLKTEWCVSPAEVCYMVMTNMFSCWSLIVVRSEQTSVLGLAEDF